MAFGSDITETIGNVGGRTTAQGFNSSDEVRKQYTGYERDDESGLDFAQARYYNSAHGRFTSIDPLTASANVKDPQTFNRYSYVLNSPYKFVDPLGLISVNAGSACGSWCKNSSGGGPIAFDDNSSKVWRLPERFESKPPEPPPAQATQGEDDPPDLTKVSVSVDKTWYVENEYGTSELEEDSRADNILDVGASAMATNVVRAIIAVSALEKYPETTYTASFSKSIEISTDGVGVSIGNGESTEYKSVDQIYNALEEANNSIRFQMAEALSNESVIMPMKDSLILRTTMGKVSANDCSSNCNLSASFGFEARKVANETAKTKIKNNLPDLSIPLHFYQKEF